MLGRRIVVFLAASLLLISISAFAQDDDTPGGNNIFQAMGKANGSDTTWLQPSTTYTFGFDVWNMYGGSEAIKKFSATFPDPDYVLDQSSLIPPVALTHEGEETGTWAVTFDSATSTIFCEYTGPSATPEIGNIRETENLTFTFIATTDSDQCLYHPGALHYWFDHVMTGDAVPPTVIEGTWHFASPAGDDDTVGDDTNDSNDADSDDDDNDDKGCGC